MRTAAILLATAVALSFVPEPARASASFVPLSHVAPDGNAVLRMADDRASAFSDQRYAASMAIHKGGKLTKTLEFDMSMKGLEKQLIVFRAPGDVAGMKVLMQDAETLYVYSPEFKKVRRIAAHMQNQGFLGSAFTYEDMTGLRLSNRYDAKLAGHRGGQTTLALSAKGDIKPTYPKLEVVIDAKAGGVTEIRYFDATGAKIREQHRDEWKTVGKLKIPTRLSMKNVKTGDETVITLTKVEVDVGIPDATFSRRMLMRGT